jgi:putative glutathione S-transferase
VTWPALEPGDNVTEFPAAKGRYHLFVSLACPWAHRTLVIRALKGLEHAVTVSVTNPVMLDQGWVFGEVAESPTPEPLLGERHLLAIYLRAEPRYSGRVTVPVLWDKEAATIVNNESRDILRMLDVEFHPWATRKISLRPIELVDEIDDTIDAIYEPINNGVYRAGFARTQLAYDEAFERLFSALDHWDSVLAERRYLCGSVLTEADVCMFTTLLRFDPVYYSHFKCNRRRIVDYRHLSAYLRELYQLPHVAGVCDFEHIKQHYHRSHPMLNPRGIVPGGPALGWLLKPHGRERLPGGPPPALVEAA